MDRASIFGNFRAKVVDNKDKQKFGRVLVWIPDLMPTVSETEGIWARPANNPLGGRNMENDAGHHFMGSSYIPKKGAWVFIFFEGGNINRPYYFGALDLENTKVLPENQLGSNYEDKWTIFKSHDGRTIIISDDPDDERVEITGKKRYISNPPSGDEFSVYRIDGNQTTILLDERDGKQKILIKSYKGDFIHFDIDDRDLEIKFARDIHIEAGGNIFVKAQGDMHFVAGKSIMTSAHDEINTIAGYRINIQTGEEYNRDVGSHSIEVVAGNKITSVDGDYYLETGGDQNIQGGGNINTDAPLINDNSGASSPAPSVLIDTKVASEAEAEGDRDT